MEEDTVREALSKALATPNDASVDRVLANAFYRTRPLQAGSEIPQRTVANVVHLSDQRERFLAVGPQGHGGTRR
jgi:hypothetical protein